MAIVGRMIKEAREKLRMSQQDIASIVGVTPAYISKLEKGANPPSDELCIKLAEALKSDANELRVRAQAERGGVDLEALISYLKNDPLVGLDPEEARVVRMWRKLDANWKERMVNLMMRAQEAFEALEVVETRFKRKARPA